MRQSELTLVEVDDILQQIKYNNGYDFTAYSRASITRRIQRFMDENGFTTPQQLHQHLQIEKSGFGKFLERLTVNVTEMFRDPDFYRSLKIQVLTMLSSYPIIKIWHAGCSTGEEVFSMAILFHEAGLLQRTRFYATDLNPVNLEKARQGILSQEVMKEYTQNYVKAGGTNDFSSYYTARYNNIIINKELRKNIVFSQHNLVTDHGFNEFQLICCRNVMIYFNKDLQKRVIRLFYDSLSTLGYLALGTKESLLYSELANGFQVIDAQQKIFRRLV